MEITYLHHAAFKLKGKVGTVITDPYQKNTLSVSFPTVSADVVTVSHDHGDHNAVGSVRGTARRPSPFIVTEPGEYEVNGISVFGFASYHDDQQGAQRGPNTIFKIVIDEVTICHLGDLGHTLTSAQIEEIGQVDVLLCPVGGEFTIDAKRAIEVIQQFEPSYVIPMHYRSEQHGEMFAKVATLEDFLKEYGTVPAPQLKVNVEKNKLPEETELVVLQPQLKSADKEA